MSKLGKKPLTIPSGVTVSLSGNVVEANGILGKSFLSLPEEVNIIINPGFINVNRTGDTKRARSMHGTYVRLLANLMNGVNQGFTKILEVVGTGFKAEMQENILVLSLGYSHQIKYSAPDGIKIQVVEGRVNVTGIDRQLVGEVAQKIKAFRQPDSYKGKGIRYLGQQLKLKPGKAAAKGTTK